MSETTQPKNPWPSDAPAGMCWKCPDCVSWATLGGNAGFHRDTRSHGEPTLVDIAEVTEMARSTHQQLVIDEKLELDDRAKKLSEFIGLSPIFETLDPAEQERMKVQNDLMWLLSEVLGQRIAAFTGAESTPTTEQFKSEHFKSQASTHAYQEAVEIATDIVKAVQVALAGKVVHQRSALELSVVRCRSRLDRLVKSGPESIRTDARLFDLVRFMRSELHEANLITDAEYAWLLQANPAEPAPGSPSRFRLESYDELRAELDSALSKLRAIPKLNIRCECHSGHVHGSTNLHVSRVEAEDDGSFTAVTDHWPAN